MSLGKTTHTLCRWLRNNTQFLHALCMRAPGYFKPWLWVKYGNSAGSTVYTKQPKEPHLFPLFVYLVQHVQNYRSPNLHNRRFHYPATLMKALNLYHTHTHWSKILHLRISSSLTYSCSSAGSSKSLIVFSKCWMCS